MSSRLRRIAVVAILIPVAAACPAQTLVVSTDQTAYEWTDTIRIRVVNPTQTTAASVCNNFWALTEVATGALLDGGCIVEGWVEFPPGYEWTWTCPVIDLILHHQTTDGTFRFEVFEWGTGQTGEPPHPRAEFEIVPTTPAESGSWSGVKALYR